jgi:hypothetical protein
MGARGVKMSIFVDPKITFPIKVRFIEECNENNEVINVKILKENEKENPNEKQIICYARGRDYDTMSKILEETTIINHISGKPMIRSKMFRYKIMENFILKWNVLDENKEMMPMNPENINKMFYSLVKKITDKWLFSTGA